MKAVVGGGVEVEIINPPILNFGLSYVVNFTLCPL